MASETDLNSKVTCILYINSSHHLSMSSVNLFGNRSQIHITHGIHEAAMAMDG